MSMKPPGQAEPRLSHEQPIWYLPATGTDAAGCGVGPAWTTDANATVSHPAPTSGYDTQFRRTRFTSTANSNIHLGLMFANSDHCSVWRGNATSRGGFYFRALFRVNAIPNNTIRFFAGLSAQVGTGVATSNTLPNNTMGLWCDTTHSASLKFGACDNGGTSSSTALTNATTLTAGTLYDFIMIANPNQGVVVTQLVNAEDDTDGFMGTVLNSQNFGTNLPGSTVFLAPQVGLGNAANNAGGDTSLDIYTIYVRPNLRLRPQG